MGRKLGAGRNPIEGKPSGGALLVIKMNTWARKMSDVHLRC